MVRRKNKEIISEILLYFLYLFSVICAFWWLSVNHLTLSRLFGIKDSVELDLGSLASILSIVSAALAIIISNRLQAYKERQIARDQIYQQLEFESVNLFRFEIENVNIARIVWDDTVTFENLKEDKNKEFQVYQHICQILNLFEMAVRFKVDGVMHEDVFKSWEVWIFELCRSEIFLNFWFLEGIRENYIKKFRHIIDEVLTSYHGKDVISNLMATIKSNNSSINYSKIIQKHLK